MKKKQTIIIAILLIFIVLLVSRKSSLETNTIYVQAAASLQNALTEIEDKFEAQGYNLEINYGGSGMLVTQIQEGAPADLFISASTVNFDNLKQTNEMVESDVLVENELVLIAPQDQTYTNIDEIDKIAIGTPDAVPAGTYAMQVLNNRNLIDQVSDKLVQAKDVTEVLTYVEIGEADLGFVYKTDALSSDGVDIIYEFGPEEHDPIQYPIGLLTENEGAQQFYDYLHDDEAQAILNEYGFVTNE